MEVLILKTDRRKLALRPETPVCHLITRRDDDVVGETILFPGAVFTFMVTENEQSPIRVGTCYIGVDPEQVGYLDSFIEATFTHINACDCPEHDGLEAELLTYE
jgi:hypothetical protein